MKIITFYRNISENETCFNVTFSVTRETVTFYSETVSENAFIMLKILHFSVKQFHNTMKIPLFLSFCYETFSRKHVTFSENRQLVSKETWVAAV